MILIVFCFSPSLCVFAAEYQRRQRVSGACAQGQPVPLWSHDSRHREAGGGESGSRTAARQSRPQQNVRLGRAGVTAAVCNKRVETLWPVRESKHTTPLVLQDVSKHVIESMARSPSFQTIPTILLLSIPASSFSRLHSDAFHPLVQSRYLHPSVESAINDPPARRLTDASREDRPQPETFFTSAVEKTHTHTHRESC